MRKEKQIYYILQHIEKDELIEKLLNKIDEYCNYDSETILNDIMDEIDR